MFIVISALLGILLDFIFGDPYFLYHPITFIGNIISLSEKFFRRYFCKNSKEEFISGIIVAILIPVFCFVLSLFILIILCKINIYIGFILHTFWVYQILALRSLEKESKKVYTDLNNNDIQKARKSLSMIVGRETKNLNKQEIIKATVETIAENTSDGITAPFLFIIIGGAPLGFFYKAVNTLDSMIGYRNEKYEFFGKAAAKFDDILNFIPSRITGFLMCISSFLLFYDYKNAFKIFFRDRKKHISPNSAQTESAASGALDISLGGTHVYFGIKVEKEIIGDNIKEAENNDILKMHKLMIVTSIIFFAVFILIRFLIFI